MKKQFILSFSLLLVAIILGVYFIPLKGLSLRGSLLNFYQKLISGAKAQSPGSLIVTADIVDGNGNFVRNLTDSEIQQVTFDIKYFQFKFSATFGSLDNNFLIKVPSARLNTSYQLDLSLGNWNILDNIKPPTGYVVRSISNGGILDSSIRNIIHFTQQPASSLVRKADEMLYVPHGISYVKNLAQAYSDNEYKYVNSEVVEHFYYTLFMSGEPNPSRPFPVSWALARFSQKPYLFMNARDVIIVYDISDPSNPVKKSEFLLSSLNDFNGDGEIGRKEQSLQINKDFGECSPFWGGNHTGFTSAVRMFALDDTPYLFIATDNTLNPSGQAILSIDTSNMSLSAHPQWTFCGSQVTVGFHLKPSTAIGMYKGSDGKTYFVSRVFPNRNNYSPNDYEKYGILSIENGKIVLVATLSESMRSGIMSELDFSNSGQIFVLTLNNKTYLLGFGGKAYENNKENLYRPLYIYDISNPLDIKKVNNGTITGFSIQAIDKQSGRIYVSEPMPNPLYSTSTASSKGYIPKNINGIKVYDITDPSSPKLLATYKKPSDLIDPNQFKSDILEIAKRLRISSSNLIDLNDFVLNGAIGTPSLHLISVSGNLAYAVLYTDDRNLANEVSWDWNRIMNGCFLDSRTLVNECTDKSEYGSRFIQFIIDIKNPSNPKILGTILPRAKVIMGGGWRYWPDDPISLNTVNFDRQSIFFYNGYIYRANYRVADIWRLGNAPTFTSQTQNDLPKNNNTQTRQPSNSLFNFNSILNVFKRVLYFNSR